MFHRTENLFLRPAFPEDWKAVLAGIGEEEIVRNLATAPWPYAEMDARRWCARQQCDWLPSFVVVLPDTGLIGSAGLGLDDATGEVQLGYWIARAYWGQGYASEAARGVIEVAKAIGHKRLVASHFIDNPASGRVLQKAGFEATGEVRPGYSLARGTHDPVACFEIVLGVSHSDGGDDGGETPEMRQAA